MYLVAQMALVIALRASVASKNPVKIEIILKVFQVRADTTATVMRSTKSKVRIRFYRFSRYNLRKWNLEFPTVKPSAELRVLIRIGLEAKR